MSLTRSDAVGDPAYEAGTSTLEDSFVIKIAPGSSVAKASAGQAVLSKLVTNGPDGAGPSFKDVLLLAVRQRRTLP